MWYIILGAIAAIVFAIAGIVASHSQRSLSIWICFAGAAISLFLIFKAWDDSGSESTNLVPGSAPTPPTRYPIPEQALAVFLGNSLSFASSFPHVVIEQGDEPLISIDREKGGLVFSAKFFSENGEIIAEIVKNRFFLNASNYFRIERRRNRLTVFDKQARITVDVTYLNKSAVLILGDFYLRNGLHVIITQDEQRFGNVTMSGFFAGEANVAIKIR